MRQLIRISLLGLLAAGTVHAIPEGPAPNTPEWFAREAANFARVSEAPTEQIAPGFQQRLQSQSLANELEWLMRGLNDPSWLMPQTGNTNLTPLCTSWMQQCAGDPFRYPGNDPFYDNEGEVIPFVIYDAQCARISGRVWAPRSASPGDALPTVVIENGSVQAPEPLYWWMAQALVRAGYVTLTFDPRGQGRSDFQTPDGEQGGNFNGAVFTTGLVNVIDFFRSSPVAPYPHNQTCAGTYPTTVTAFNPFWDRMDADRLGLAGHSLGASGVSNVQAFGAPGEEPWPGLLDAQNPVDVIVAWDSLSNVTPRVPAMGQTSEYGLTPVINLMPPDPEGHKNAFNSWKDAGLPVYQLTIQGSTHYEWSLIPTFPTTSWCPETGNNRCEGGWGRPMGEHYSVAWFDRWLKQPGEPGFEDADARLLADADWLERYSFYSRSARNFPDRNGIVQSCEDIRAGCSGPTPSPTPMPTPSPSASPTPPPSPVPTATPAPSAAPTATPSATPTAPPVVTPPPTMPTPSPASTPAPSATPAPTAAPTATPAATAAGDTGSGSLGWLAVLLLGAHGTRRFRRTGPAKRKA